MQKYFCKHRSYQIVRKKFHLNFKFNVVHHTDFMCCSKKIYLISIVFITGVIHPWSGRFYSLWDTGYAKIHIPIIASVSEHQPTTWVSFFFDLHILVCAFPAGVWYCVKHVNDERVFGKPLRFILFL